MDIPAGGVETVVGTEAMAGTGAGIMETTNAEIKTKEMFCLHRDQDNGGRYSFGS